MIEKLPWFEFAGESSKEHDLIILDKTTWNGAERDQTFTSVSGRSGDLLTDNRRFKNLKIKYNVAAVERYHTIRQITRRVKGWLYADAGYFRLRDSYDPDYFRLAATSGDFDFDQKLTYYGEATIEFNCKPFRYLIEGQEPILITSTTTLTNPEAFPSLPYLKIVGDGDVTLSVGAESFVFRGIDSYIELDSETMQAYKGTVSENAKMYTPSFPALPRGKTEISWIGNVESVEIVPRWCTL